MLSILMAHSYFLRFDAKQFERARPYPPLATLQVAALLREAGHEVALFDAMLAEGPAEFEQQLAEVRPQLVLLYEDNFNYLTKMCLARMREAGCRMVAAAHRGGARVIVAGSDVSDAPEPYLRAGADAALLGEGLGALLELLRYLDEAGPQAERLPVDIAGAATLVDDRVRIGAAAPAAEPGARVIALRDARARAEPAFDAATTAWDLVDIGRYRAMWRAAHGRFSLNMAASKGCSFRCAWCAKPIWGNRYQQRGAAVVAAEMLHLKSAFAPDHIWFADDIFGFRADWVEAFAAALTAGGGGIPFTIQTRADLVSVAMAEALRRAGCDEVWLGAESGSQAVLDAMHKGTTIDEIVTARARLRDAGIRVGFFIQLGYLGERLDDLLATRRLIELTRPDAIGVSVAYPLPGTPFHDQVKAQLGAKTNWDDSGDLAMMFEGTYDSAFYRRIRDLLHAQVERALSGDALEQRWRALLADEPQHRTERAMARLAS